MPDPLHVLALHGFSGSGADFDPLRAAHDSLTWHTPDLPGHGANLPADPAAYGVPAIAREVSALLHALPRPRILLGYSMGGRIALHTALLAPTQIDGLVLIGASPGLPNDERAARVDLDDARARRVRALGAAAFAAEWARVPLIATQERIPEPWRGAMSARRRQADTEGLARSLERTGTGRMAPLLDLSALTCPALLVVGECDDKFRRIAEAMSLPQSQLCVLSGAGHAAHLEQPAAFLAVFERWRTDVPGLP